MIALRYVYVVALAIWVGGLITIGSVVAPSAFAVLEAASGATTPSVAATLVGEVLRRFHVVGYAAGAVLLSTLILMKMIGPRPPAFGARLVLVAAMLGVSLVTGFWVDPQIASMRTSVGVSISTLAPDDGRRVRFGRLHGLSTLLMVVTTLGGLVLCYWETRE
jgi:putative copper export protein